ncbi:FLYWCH-type zinc finger-containing protein 1-like [Aedes albopictus]|uniref:FLYWCH-type domain-containing protein n=1 Tax=Aedes albopictus TaxID=7160 RepID=A0ABM1ZAC4_AEDAL
MLWYGNYGYFREKQKHNTTNWKCACYNKYRCKARAVTKEIGGEYYFRITCDEHTHPPYSSGYWRAKRRNEVAPLTSVVHCSGRIIFTLSDVSYILNKRGATQLCINGYPFIRSKTTEEYQYWTCREYKALRCTARAVSGRRERRDDPTVKLRGVHNHVILKRRDAEESAKDISFTLNKRGATQLCVNGYPYIRSKTTEDFQYWSCSQYKVLRCPARAISGRRRLSDKPTIKLRGTHNHGIILERRKPGESAKLLKLNSMKGREMEVLPEKRKRSSPGASPPPVECVLGGDNPSLSK